MLNTLSDVDDNLNQKDHPSNQKNQLLSEDKHDIINSD